MKVRIPLDQAQPVGTLPDGKYRLRVVEASLAETNKGEEAIKIRYVVVAPEKIKGQRVKGLQITRTYTYNGIGLEELRLALTALLGKELPRKAAVLDLDSLVGKVCEAEAVQRNGYTNLRNYKPVGGEEAEGLEDEADGSDVGDDDDEE